MFIDILLDRILSCEDDFNRAKSPALCTSIALYPAHVYLLGIVPN